MKKLLLSLLLMVLVSGLIFGGCAKQAPSPTPAPAPAPAPKPAPTPAPAPTPTPAPAPAPTPAPKPAPAPAPAGARDLLMTGATLGSGTYAINLGMAEIWNKYVQKPTKVNVIVRPYMSIPETFMGLEQGKANITWAPSAFAFYIKQGIGPYQQLGKKNYYTLFEGGGGVGHIITNDPKIKSVADLKGKRWSAKKAGDPNLEQLRAALLQANGMTDADIKLIEYTGFDCFQQVKDGTSDALMTLTSGLNPTIEELFIAKNVYYVPVNDAEVAAVEKSGPYWFKDAIPAGTYKGQTTAVPVVTHMEGVFVKLDFDQELAYELTKALYDHWQEFSAYHATSKYWTLELANKMERLYHPYSPSSVKYFKEKGVWNDQKEARQQQLLKEAGL